MSLKKIYFSLLGLLLSLAAVSQSIHPNDTISLKEIDGPYIFHNEQGIKSIRVSEFGVEITQHESRIKEKPFWVSSQNGKHKFEVTLRDITRPEWKYEQTDSTFVMSDPHANIDAFVAILQAHKIIDDKYNWNFGKNRLMIIGDVFDRGDDVLPIFWLIYKIQGEAERAGGSVHFLLGNHEEMVMWNDVRYANKKYKDLAIILDKPHSEMWTADSELGHWLRTRNMIEVIGDNLFVHAGLSKEFLDQEWDIAQMNDSISAHLGENKKERNKSKVAKFLFTSNGPFWYRGMVHSEEKYNPIKDKDVNRILKFYNVSCILVGHTIFDEVSTFYKGKVIAVNVSNQKNREAGRSRAAFITRAGVFKVYDDPANVVQIAK